MKLKDIKEFTKEWKTDIKNRVFDKDLTLCIIQVGDNEASNRYVRNKIRDCEEVGIKVKLLKFPDTISQLGLEEEIYKANINLRINGIMVQLPLPAHLNFERIKKNIFTSKDVDGFNPCSDFNPCTPLGIMKYLDYCGFDLDGKHVVIIGRSDIVGKPLARMMTEKNATVTLCHSHTKNLEDFCQAANLIVSAVGKPRFLNCYSIYCPVIDVGINFVDGKLVGDCYNTENRDVTPVPGGVGLLTRCALLENLAKGEK